MLMRTVGPVAVALGVLWFGSHGAWAANMLSLEANDGSVLAGNPFSVTLSMSFDDATVGGAVELKLLCTAET